MSFQRALEVGSTSESTVVFSFCVFSQLSWVPLLAISTQESVYDISLLWTWLAVSPRASGAASLPAPTTHQHTGRMRGRPAPVDVATGRRCAYCAGTLTLVTTGLVVRRVRTMTMLHMRF